MTIPHPAITTHESIMDHKIIMFTKPQCVQCDQTKRVLNKRGIDFHEIDIESENTRLTDQRYATPYEFCTETLSAQTAPVILVHVSMLHPSVRYEAIYGEFALWTGFRPDHLKGITPAAVES